MSEFDEEAWIAKNPHPVTGWPDRPVTDFSEAEKKKHNSWKTRKSRAKRLSTPKGKASAEVALASWEAELKLKYSNNPELFEADHPNPVPSKRLKDMTPKERRAYGAWKQHRHRCGLSTPVDTSRNDELFDEVAWLRENPRPNPGIKIKDMTRQQKSEYDRWKSKKSRDRRSLAAIEADRERDAETKQRERDRWPDEVRAAKNAFLRTYRAENPEKTKASDAEKRAKRLKRVPKWQTEKDREKNSEIYDIARTISKKLLEPHQVDHVIPLQGKRVSGLHTPDNLKIVPAAENHSKKNKFTPGDPPPIAGLRAARRLKKKYLS